MKRALAIVALTVLFGISYGCVQVGNALVCHSTERHHGVFAGWQVQF